LLPIARTPAGIVIVASFELSVAAGEVYPPLLNVTVPVVGTGRPELLPTVTVAV